MSDPKAMTVYFVLLT